MNLNRMENEFCIANLSLMVLSSSIAEAANRYALTCIANRTQVTVNYKVRWGDRSWRSSSISPGRNNWHSWKYKYVNDNSSPRLQVSFDSDLSNATYW